MIKHKGRFESWLPAAFDGEFTWDFLAPCFHGTKIMPMDFDAVVERRGHFLVFETKIKGKDVDLGQAITLTAAWKGKGFSIIQVEGKTFPEVTGMAIYSEWDTPKDGKVGDKPIEPCDATDVIYKVRCWFNKASGYEFQSRSEWNNEIWLSDYELHSE